MGPDGGSSVGLYMGVVIPVTAAFALRRRARPRWLWRLFGIALLSLETSTGALPFRGWLYDLFLWERVARHGVQRKDLALFLLSVLALHGAPEGTDADGSDSGVRTAESWRAFFACAAAVALVATAVGIAGASFLGVAGPRPVLAVAHSFVVWGGVAGLGLLVGG